MDISIDQIIPARDNMIVKRLEQTTGGTLVLPNAHAQRAELVEVVRCGSECEEYKKGDILIKSSWSGSELDFISLGHDWDKYRLISEEQVVAQIEGK